MVNPSEVVQLRIKVEKERRRRQKSEFAEKLFASNYHEWLRLVFPRTFVAELAPYHREFWEWLWKLEPGKAARPFIAVWPRGFSKTTNAEAAMVYAAAKGYKYGLYLKGTQNQADDAVSNIGDRLESPEIAMYYPGLADRKVNKFGSSKGWRRNRLMTASGFAIDALGLDVAKRGAKLSDYRPDFLVIDDIDEKHDTLNISDKKVTTITTSLIPTLTPESAVLVVQNLIIPHGVVSRLANSQPENVPEADFLADRIISGPHPAVEGLQYAKEVTSNGKHYWKITAGKPTWSFMDIPRLEAEMNRMGPEAFEKEKQNETKELEGGMFYDDLFVNKRFNELPELEEVQVWLDPAITSTDQSDNQGVIVDGRGVDNVLYRLHAWEGVESPHDVLKRAAMAAYHYQATLVGIETNQGGELWGSTFITIWRDLVRDGDLPEEYPRPRVKDVTVSKADGPKRTRWQEMKVNAYERGMVVHAIGTHTTLEKSLKRLPSYKPYDLADAAYLSWKSLMSNPIREDIDTTPVKARRTR